MIRDNDCKSFVFGGTIYEQIKELPEEQQPKFYTAFCKFCILCCKYGLYNKEPEFTGIERHLCLPMRNLIKTYKDSQNNRKKGGRSKSDKTKFTPINRGGVYD
jgi:hypothetical protein